MAGQAAEREAAVRQVAAHGWYRARVTGDGYYQMHCACGRHIEHLHKTPSSPNHYRQKVAKMIRDCSTQRQED